MRLEKDFIGTVEIPGKALYGIHAARARDNFPDTTGFNQDWFKAVGIVKQAVYQTCLRFYKAVDTKYSDIKVPIKRIEEDILEIMTEVSGEVSQGAYFEHFIVPAISGGAGTSINMNVNEIIANASLLKKGSNPGNYQLIDPVEHANIFQSTNDVIPTALKIATLQLLNRLEDSINDLRADIEIVEGKTLNALRIAYTQMQEAVPSTYGRLFSTYCEALSRDWWRVSKCFERIKVVNMGGSAVGTGLSVPRYVIMEVTNTIRQLTGLPVTRSENLSDATNNLDALVEIHGILKAHAVNLEKMVNDLRLLSSDLVGEKDLELPARQVGSSVMPAKVNPVIVEYVISATHTIYANDNIITSLSASGCLDLNAYLPVIGHALLGSLKLLIGANKTIRNNLIQGLVIHDEVSEDKLLRSPAITTVLIPYIGYHKATEIAKEMKDKKQTILEVNARLKWLEDEKLKDIIRAQNIVKEGFSIKDLL